MVNAYSVMNIERGRKMVETLLLFLWLFIKVFFILLVIDVALITFFEVMKEIIKRRNDKR